MQYLLFGIFFIFAFSSISQPIEQLTLNSTQLTRHIQMVIHVLSDPDADAIERLKIMRAMNNNESIHPTVQQKLSKLVLDSNSIIQWEALGFFKLIQLDNFTILQKLTTASADSNSIIQWKISQILKLNQLYKLIDNKEFNDLLSNSNSVARLRDLKALKENQKNNPAVHRQLADALSDSNIIVQWEALKALRLAKSRDPIVQSKIADMLSHQNEIIRWEALLALKESQPNNLMWISAVKPPQPNQFNNPTVQQKIANTLSDLNTSIRLQAILTLYQIQSVLDVSIYPKIAQALFDSKSYIRLSAAKIFKKHLPTMTANGNNILNDSIIQQQLITASLDSDPEVRKTVQDIFNHLKSQQHKTIKCVGVF